jgi:hypothetical protein
MSTVSRRCVTCGKSFQRAQPKDRRKHCRDCRPSQTPKMMGGKTLPQHRNLERLDGLPPETVIERPKNPTRYLRTRDGEIVPDAKRPGMYRIKWRAGGLSDMINYTRASAALRGL